jgi:hypothetical protein
MQNLLQSVIEERRKYPTPMTDDQCVDMCNAVAWRHRAEGWGLSRKVDGVRGRRHDGQECAHDILHHLPTNELFDVLVGAPNTAAPVWQPKGPPQSADRTWVAPIATAGVSVAPVAPQPPVPGPQPVTESNAAILQAVQALAARLDLLAHNSTLTAEGVQRLEAALAAGIPLRLRAKLIGDVTGTVGGPQR